MVLGTSVDVYDSQAKSPPIDWKYVFQRYNNTITDYQSNASNTITPYNNVSLTGTQTINGVSVAKTLYCSDNLSGVYSYLTITGNTSGMQILANEDFTISFWCYPTLYRNTNNFNGWNALFQLGNDRSRCILLRFGQTGFLQVNSTNQTSFTKPPINAWHFVTINRDKVNQKVRLYINGTLTAQVNLANSATIPPSAPTYTSEANLAVGTSYNNVQECFNGYISEFYFIRGTSLDGTVIVNPPRTVPPPS